ncbi:N-acetylmuramoyl-L-alanine amidase [Anthropogastromicrobium sp.]|uniref:N-acetylmuramoyl-L-alanine amidase n=1 Tax=Anthropogastromicrobium sp. TaxID=2981649 RepID=UPI00307B53AD
MTTSELIKIAKVIYAEGGIFSGKNQNALLAIAQCIHDLLPNYDNLDCCLKAAFTKPTDQYDPECLQAVRDVFESGKRRFQDAEILQFRSFTKYSDGNGQPDREKLADLFATYDYLGSDSISKEWGHLYFGKKKEKNMSFRLLVMAGHGRNSDGSWDPGAVGNGYQEANLTRELRDLIKAAADRAGVPCDVAPDRNHYSYFKHGGQYDFTPYTYVLEVHFNASATADFAGDGKMKGSMVYIDKSETGHSVEDAILNNLYSIGSRQAWDGVVVTQRQESYKNGLMVQSKVRAQGVSHAVLETCFVTDQDDMDWYLVNKSKIAQAIIAGIQQGFGLNYTKAITPYMVKVDVSSIPDHVLNIREQPTINSPVNGKITETMSLTIIEEASGKGAKRWGKLKSGAGWISLDYTVR